MLGEAYTVSDGDYPVSKGTWWCSEMDAIRAELTDRAIPELGKTGLVDTLSFPE